MATSRDLFLQRVRDAVQAGNRPGSAAPLPPRGSIGYQGAGSDPVARFRDELAAAGGQPHLVASADEAAAKVVDLIRAKSPKTVLLGQGSVVERLELRRRLQGQPCEVVSVGASPSERHRDDWFAAGIGISGADFLVAETGSIVVRSSPTEPRSLSLLPPIHIVIADRTQLVPDLFDLLATLPLERDSQGTPVLPSGVAIITGPSKTGDIELKLVTGVHGPGEVHVVLITG